MLKKITLVNFMSHERTELELHQGVNVLVGPNNCGKSAIVEALRAVCEHTKRNFMIRHGEKRCHVIVETIEGDVIEWQRTKTSAKFLLNDEEIARIGRGELPAKLHQLLRMPKVRSQDKKGLFDVHLGLQASAGCGHQLAQAVQKFPLVRRLVSWRCLADDVVSASAGLGDVKPEVLLVGKALQVANEHGPVDRSVSLLAVELHQAQCGSGLPLGDDVCAFEVPHQLPSLGEAPGAIAQEKMLRGKIPGKCQAQ